MEDTLHKRVVGQDEAVKAVARAIRRGRVGLKLSLIHILYSGVEYFVLNRDIIATA